MPHLWAHLCTSIPAKLTQCYLFSGKSCHQAHRLQTQPRAAWLLQWASSGLGLPASVLDLHQPRSRPRVHCALSRPLEHRLQNPGADNIRSRGLRGDWPWVRPRPAPRPRQPPPQPGIPARPPPSQGWTQTFWK